MAEFVTVAQTTDVPPGSIILVELDDEGVAIANVTRGGELALAFQDATDHHMQHPAL